MFSSLLRPAARSLNIPIPGWNRYVRCAVRRWMQRVWAYVISAKGSRKILPNTRLPLPLGSGETSNIASRGARYPLLFRENMSIQMHAVPACLDNDRARDDGGFEFYMRRLEILQHARDAYRGAAIDAIGFINAWEHRQASNDRRRAATKCAAGRRDIASRRVEFAESRRNSVTDNRRASRGTRYCTVADISSIRVPSPLYTRARRERLARTWHESPVIIFIRGQIHGGRAGTGAAPFPCSARGRSMKVSGGFSPLLSTGGPYPGNGVA